MYHLWIWERPSWRVIATYDTHREAYAAGLPILADALEEASCDNADILGHCRQSGDHVRGCWVLDLLLGKD